MDHSPGFLKLVNDAKKSVSEISVAEARARLTQNPRAILMDVREDHEWQAGHAVEAVHLGKGIFERDLEKLQPDPQTEILMYCGGGAENGLPERAFDHGRLQGAGAGGMDGKSWLTIPDHGHRIQLVFLGATVGGICRIDGDFRENWAGRCGFGLCHAGAYGGDLGGADWVCFRHGQVERSLRVIGQNVVVSGVVWVGDRCFVVVLLSCA